MNGKNDSESPAIPWSTTPEQDWDRLTKEERQRQIAQELEEIDQMLDRGDLEAAFDAIVEEQLRQGSAYKYEIPDEEIERLIREFNETPSSG